MKISVDKLLLCLLTLLLVVGTGESAAAAARVDWKNVRVLVYTKNGKGYVHDNIPNAVACLQRLGRQHGFKVDVADDPSVFTEENLSQYRMLIFPSTNNDVFDTDEQRLVFRRYIEGGGGFVGIHSVVGTERNWRWFKMMLGGTFLWHAKFQKYSIRVIDAAHPTAQGLPKVWVRSDECYFMKELYPGISTILAHDFTTLAPDEKIKAAAAPFTDLYPAVWHQRFDGGHVWITALGHDKKDYEDPLFVRHIMQGIDFIAGRAKKPDFSRAYAGSRDEPVRY